MAKRTRSFGDIFRRRTLAIGLIIVVIAVSCVVKLSYIQLYNGAALASQAAQSRTVDRRLQGVRGTITDINNVTLAQSIESYTIFADQQAASQFKPVACKGRNNGICQETTEKKAFEVEGPASIARMLAPILQMDVKELGAKLTGSNRYVILQRNALPQVKRQIDQLNISSIIGFELTSNREYSDDGLLGTILGGVDNTGNGVAGLELMENEALVGHDGHVVYQRGRNGQEIPGTRTESSDPKQGGTVQLTIDRDVQWYVKKALVDGKNKYHAQYGIAVVQRVSDGQIVAIADTDEYQAGSDDAKTHTSRAITEVFEPGSTGKLITAAAVLQEGLHQPADHFSVPYSIKVDGQTIHDSHEHGVEQLTLGGILKVSSNVGTLMSAQNLSYDKRLEYIKKFGIGESTGIQFPGESSGQIVDNASQWDLRTRQTVLFGQGYSASALQMTNVVATIANKGVRNAQRLIASATDAQGNNVTPQSAQPVRVIDEDNANKMMNMMESVAQASQKLLNMPGYRIAGKSGTAEVAGEGGSLSGIMADFIGVIPADNPQFVITVVYRDPEGLYGIVTAGPVFAQIGEFLMQKYQIPASAPRTDAIPTEW